MKFEVPFRYSHGDGKEPVGYVSVVFREVEAGHMDLGTDGINSRGEMPLVTLIFFLHLLHRLWPQGPRQINIHHVENHLESGTPPRATAQRPRHHMCFLSSWTEQVG